MSVIREDTFPAWFLDIVYLDVEVIAISDTQARSNVELFQTFADMLQLWVRHLSVQFSAERGSDEENVGNDIGSFVEATDVALVSVFIMLLSH